ncbi:hypothetical protein MKW94_027911 [Papaver nudicaule]|uniref:DNA2/NAM7 helicase helicase domain-containing protein n=1 Tax=Papaver nudicaule TaxID=74823 RepID=A0AA42AP70_PAPNU|nr:hypothetical protein [Papaver nudicaule]
MVLSDVETDSKSEKDDAYNYKPKASDVIAFSDVRPESCKDFVRISYIPAIILYVEDDTTKPYLVDVLTSKPIMFEHEYLDTNMTNRKGRWISDPLFAVYLTNMTTNLRIWRALSDESNGHIIQEVLQAKSQIGCNFCHEAELRLSKDLELDLDSFNLNESQLHAVLSSIATSSCSHQNSVKLIWGPPGTGKTTMIGVLLNALLKLKCKTLTCAPTNTAVVEVTTRLMKLMISIVKPSLESNNYGLGDILIFGNAERLKIDNTDHVLRHVFLDYRCEKLGKCLAPRGWKFQLNSMIILLEETYEQYILHLETEKDPSKKKSLKKKKQKKNLLKLATVQRMW